MTYVVYYKYANVSSYIVSILTQCYTIPITGSYSQYPNVLCNRSTHEIFHCHSYLVTYNYYVIIMYNFASRSHMVPMTGSNHSQYHNVRCNRSTHDIFNCHKYLVTYNQVLRNNNVELHLTQLHRTNDRYSNYSQYPNVLCNRSTHDIFNCLLQYSYH